MTDLLFVIGGVGVFILIVCLLTGVGMRADNGR